MTPTKMYICDPVKNKDCRKDICYMNCNQPSEYECRYTSDINFAKYPQTDETPFIMDDNTLWEQNDEITVVKPFKIDALSKITKKLDNLIDRITRMEKHIHYLHSEHATDTPVYLEDKNGIS